MCKPTRRRVFHEHGRAMPMACFTNCERQREAAHREQTAVSVSKGEDIAHCTGPSAAASACSYRAGLWVRTDGP